MTAPTLPKAETALIEHAQAVRSRAQLIDWPESAAKTIGDAYLDLTSLEDKYFNLLNEVIHWDAYEWADDPRSYAEPFEVALRMAAVEADYAAGYLIEMVGKHCKAEDAARVSGEGDEGE